MTRGHWRDLCTLCVCVYICMVLLSMNFNTRVYLSCVYVYMLLFTCSCCMLLPIIDHDRLIPRPFPLPTFDCLQYAKTAEDMVISCTLTVADREYGRLAGRCPLVTIPVTRRSVPGIVNNELYCMSTPAS